MKRLATAMVALGFVAAALATARAQAGKPSAAEIVAKNVAARGGLDAWRKVETMVWVGRIESAHTSSPVMPFSLEQKRPNKTRFQIEAPGYKSVRVFDGARGWKMRLGQPEVQPYAPQELKSARAGHGIDGPLIDHAAKGNSVRLEGVEEIGKRRAYHLEVRLAGGGDEDVWVDAETFLETRYDRVVEGPGGGPRRASATYGDYRAVQGLQIPFLIQTGGGPGATPDRMVIERVVLNAPLEDSVFGNPDQRSRLRGRPGTATRASAPSAPSSQASEERGSVPP